MQITFEEAVMGVEKEVALTKLEQCENCHGPASKHVAEPDLDGRLKVRGGEFGIKGLPGGITFVPDATIDDGYLDVVITSPRSILGWLWVAAKILFRHAGPIPVITYHRVKRVDVRVSEATGTQLDGDTSGIYQLSLKLALVRQFRPQFGLAGPISAIALAVSGNH